MITNRDAKGTRISAMSENALSRLLAERGYMGEARETYIADAKRSGVAHLLGLETIRYKRTSRKFTIIIPTETEAYGEWASQNVTEFDAGFGGQDISELRIPNYQTLAIEHKDNDHYLYMGSNFVVMNAEQWEEFKDMILPF